MSAQSLAPEYTPWPVPQTFPLLAAAAGRSSEFTVTGAGATVVVATLAIIGASDHRK